jgi:aminoglycoside 6'-N-acetyltransferase I
MRNSDKKKMPANGQAAPRPLLPGDTDEWVRMRVALWPESSSAELAEEARTFFDETDPVAVLVSPRLEGGLCGFIELSIRPWTEGCRSRGVGYIEGWYVDPDVRQMGVGCDLVRAGEEWARSRGCTEMASDAVIDNAVSIAAHGALGYEQVERVVRFRKDL